MQLHNVSVQKEKGIGKLIINRPPYNVMDIETSEEINTALENFDKDSEVKVVILTGTGNRYFSAGADVGDHLGDKYNDHNLVEVWIRDAGEIIMDPREFKKMIKTCLDNPSEKSEIRRKLRDYFFYSLDGKATERAAKVILDLEKQ